MAGWLALSDGGMALGSGPDLERGCLMFDLGPRQDATTVLMEHGEGPDALSLIHDAGFGLGLMLRRGATLARHMLPVGAQAASGGLVQFRWDAATGHWSLDLSGGASAWGQGAQPLPRALLAAVMAGPRLRSTTLRWFGLAEGASVATLPLIGPRTPIATTKGTVTAAELRPGDVVLTRDHGPRRLLSVQRHDLPGRGSLAPIRLRSPFFGAACDVLVSASQQVMLSGVEVEYLFGEDAVLVEARHLADGSCAVAEEVAGVLPWIALDLGCEATLLSGGCALSTVRGASMRTLAPFEIRALQTMRRKSLRSAA
ncbi:MAG: hypothetical protein DI533_09500 [Cereibacter sphaeroides]|uniref:Hedgehog/Intein (Hint) domain-containing protein n=1 Tax=Cereibacter sphaeroides TaxID=1063 RepID=A0A2W5SN21_CERSP|nr:MAG: hypothetical protein DI533_09500 [Cereibacter sphaeroides]